ncbi:MAG: chemotaxis protein, partial [Campylobacterota bacterium]
SSLVMDIEGSLSEIGENIDKDMQLFDKLATSFPHIESFKEAASRAQESKEKLQSAVDNCQMAGDETMMAMDGMQYQDIHRQKIERVINVMRALSKYMHSLFEGQIDDTKRVGSATHLDGDTTTENLVDNDDIEELIASLGKKE